MLLVGLCSIVVVLVQVVLGLLFLWVCKGLEVGIGLLLYQVVVEVNVVVCGVLIGFSFVVEVVCGLFMVMMLVLSDVGFVVCMVQELYGNYLCIYVSDDVVGVEVGGVVKNVLVIVIGICDGFGLGNNVCVVLIMCGLVEIMCFGEVFGVCCEMLMGLIGVGDFIFICIGDFLCNCQVGFGLVLGKMLVQVVVVFGYVVEGVFVVCEVLCCVVVMGIDMLIIDVVCVLFDGKIKLVEVVVLLMSCDLKVEGV